MNKTRIPMEILTKIKEARAAATMENASFGFKSEVVSSNPHACPPIIDMPIDEFIKERTRPYRDSWIINYLDEVIEWAERNGG